MSEAIRCLWCHGAGGEIREIEIEAGDRLASGRRPRRFHVHPEHEAELREFQRRLRRHGRAFLVAVVSLLGLMVLMELPLIVWSVRWGVAGMGLCVAVLGALLVALPFATPETVRLWGVRRAVRAVRGVGYAVAGLGVAAVVAALALIG